MNKLAWQAFLEALRRRLDRGAIAYGDDSFKRDPLELVGELQEEALDLAGWGFVLWARLERMRVALLAAGDLTQTVRIRAWLEAERKAADAGDAWPLHRVRAWLVSVTDPTEPAPDTQPSGRAEPTP